ncbi:hypothetical protein GCM10011515_15310 [Tsuneonella deserti]|uniref:Uncharacterized protein n=1 Tax=Tsuneonella deserti TaxID=2035528 RepID=A0ABQ1S9Z8_9SPHN|nr:hypothetical protein [Tsuneonella deserti]GGD96351.1 hypothetical protein GCM10011515_15310 [Tsuneonella deserti]
MDAPQTPGDWRYGPAAGGTAARFGEPGSEARFTIACLLPARTVQLVRNGPVASGGPMTLRSESATRAVSAAPSADGLRAALSANDPLLDAIAFSKGRFAVETPGAPPLYLPSWPEVTRVIEDCR